MGSQKFMLRVDEFDKVANIFMEDFQGGELARSGSDKHLIYKITLNGDKKPCVSLNCYVRDGNIVSFKIDGKNNLIGTQLKHA